MHILSQFINNTKSEIGNVWVKDESKLITTYDV